MTSLKLVMHKYRSAQPPLGEKGANYKSTGLECKSKAQL